MGWISPCDLRCLMVRSVFSSQMNGVFFFNFMIFLVKGGPMNGSRHKRKHPKGRRKVGRKKRLIFRRRRAARTNG